MAIGERWMWRHEPRGGYGYVALIPVTIVRTGPKRIQVEALLKTGGTRVTWVARESLVKQGQEG
jgi:hypothetical protein